MTTITFTDYDIPFNRFDQPLLGVASDFLHLVYFWPATSDSFGLIEDVEYEPPTREFKRAMLEKQDGTCPWCEDLLDFDDIEIDHVWPVSKGGRNWVLNKQALHGPCNREKADRIDFAVKNISPLLPHLVSSIRWLSKHPRLAALIVGGIALVVTVAIVVKWLREYVDGVRRYMRLVRLARESLSRLTRRHSGTLSGRLEGASERARQVRSRACGFAQNARGVAGQMPTRAVHMADKARDRSFAHATNMSDHASQTVRGATGAARRTASTALNGVSNAPVLAQRAAQRVAGLLPRPWRGTRPEFAVSTLGALSRVTASRPWA